MRKLIGALALAALLTACGQATAPTEEAPASAAYPAEEAPADPAAAPADSAEPSTEAPGYSPPQD
ncbi:MAG TPA: hypothetical protein DHW63_08670 [Hyphomonadaceae bacterium]|nr:hypothetical protein [Hyphomonadaceae bacterium]